MRTHNATWDKIWELDDERRQIEARIILRAKIHAGTYPPEVGELEGLKAHNAHEDAMRYIELEDQAWELMGLKTGNAHEQPPE